MDRVFFHWSYGSSATRVSNKKRREREKKTIHNVLYGSSKRDQWDVYYMAIYKRLDKPNKASSSTNARNVTCPMTPEAQLTRERCTTRQEIGKFWIYDIISPNGGRRKQFSCVLNISSDCHSRSYQPSQWFLARRARLAGQLHNGKIIFKEAYNHQEGN